MSNLFKPCMCAILLIQISLGFAKLYPCERIQNGRTCYIENITIESWENHQSVQFQDVLQLSIESSFIPLFSTDLFGSLGEANFLTLKGGSIHAVNFSSETLNSLRIDKTGLRNLSIASIQNHNLNTLMINRNPLSELPKSIRYLLALSILDLSQNQLEYVTLDWFQHMDNLLVLDLSWNHITRIDGSSGLRLKRLKNFWLNHNRLTLIAWFPIGFPKLERVRLSDNHWNCAWVASARQQIWDRKIRVFDSDAACSENSEGGLCCYDTAPSYPHAKYEVIDIDLRTQPEGIVFQQLIEEPRMMAEQQRENDTCRALEEKTRLLQREMLMLVKEKAEMEQQFAKKVGSLQDILRGVREDLEESEKEVSRYRMKERLDLVARTGKLHDTANS